ncbi:hypothetical protein K504DRAFT_463591 [Pleomassaria siparia CBS 279.74]|uniref:Uncharacterized protein n=1 Tax=Pleomassaria siparia CBS 279.74 TaxID=1314801 RepID=A0A6G1JSF3_9PLEO|nr:hypothetical protein K504DRAFT_463591 [Pleomassaria siparia CBS 279.74]
MTSVITSMLVALIFLLASSSSTLAQDTKTAFLQDFAVLDERADHKPPYPASTVTKWDNGSYPSFCYDTANAAKADDDQRLNCEIKNLEVFTVAYADCTDKPWTICRCTDAQLSVDSTVNAFGRVPPGVRSHVVHIMVLDGSKPDGTMSKSGGSNNDRFVIRGPIDDAAFAHEAFHSVDVGFSGSDDFTRAHSIDSCVPDNYANASPAEDFAQLGVWLDYETNGIRISAYVGPDRDQSCMVAQLTLVRKYSEQWMDLKMSKCFERKPNDLNVVPNAKMGVLGVAADGEEEEERVRKAAPPIKWEHEHVW